MTGAWKGDDLARIGDVVEVEIFVRRRDGTLRDPVTVWVVRAGDDLYVRSAVKGRDAAWYRAVRDTHEGRIAVGRTERDVGFEDADPALNDEVDAAYRSKYRRYAGRILNSCLTPSARSTTLRIVPTPKLGAFGAERT